MNTNSIFSRFCVMLTSAYIGGLCLCKLSPETRFYILLFCLSLFASVLVFSVKSIILKRHCGTGKIFCLFMLAMFFFGAFKTVCWRQDTISLLKNFDGKTALFRAEIISEPKADSYGNVGAQIKVFDLTCDGFEYKICDRFYLKFKQRKDCPANFGDKIRFCAEVDLKSSKSQNYRSTNCVLPLSSSFYTKYGRAEIFKNPIKLYKYAGIFLKSEISYAADRVFGYGTKSRAVVKAVITGDKTDFSDSLYSNFASAGFLHIAAVSGMHVSILFAAFSNLLAAARIKRKFAVALSPVLIIMFCSVAAFTPSVLRAAIMTILALLSTIFSREYDSVTALFLSAFVILVFYPYALFSPAFLLSFGATLGICLMYRPLMNQKAIKRAPALLGGVTSSFCTSLSAFLGITAFEVYYFKTINLTSLITNLWIVPSVSYLFCLGLLSCIVYYICPAISFKVLRCFTEPFIFLAVKTSDIFSQAGNISLEVNFMPAVFFVFYIGAVVIFIYLLNGR